MTVLKEKVKKDARALIQDDETKDILKRSLQYLKAGYSVHFTGPSGAGKTSLALALAKKRKRPIMLMHGNHELNNKDLIGDFTGYTSKKVVDQYVRSVYKKDESVSEMWKDGRLLEAVKNGYTLIYDEFTRSRPTTNNIFLSILEEGVLPLYGSKLTEPFVRVHPDFAVIFTSNPAEYAGVYDTQDALLDRLITMFIDYKDVERETMIVTEKTDVEESEARAITTLVMNLRESCSNDKNNGPSLRASIMIAKLASEQDIPIDGEDADFQSLCIDILCHPISRCLDSEDSKAKAEKLIIDECRKMDVTED
ncbi:gas vesicle protein GvpN [Metabacillus idriensis]|uniref:gas vesicle protein GvpN n=1 Tax=Metabacillus idriensis TaxID=324768 RepID=UPI00174DA2EB|nr:gas vesicle protein GvpN [Metabacillus idriensis]